MFTRRSLQRLLILFISISNAPLFSATVDPYLNKKGKYVSAYQRSKKDKSAFNNYSTKNNVNPYTGKKGTKRKYGKVAF